MNLLKIPVTVTTGPCHNHFYRVYRSSCCDKHGFVSNTYYYVDTVCHKQPIATCVLISIKMVVIIKRHVQLSLFKIVR